MTQHTQPVGAAQHQHQQHQQQPQQHQQQTSTPQQQQTTTTLNTNNNNNTSNNNNSTSTPTTSNISANNNQTQTVAVQQQHPNNNNSYQSPQQQPPHVAGGQMFNPQLQSGNVYVPTHGMQAAHHHPQHHHHQPGAMYQTMIPAAIPSNVYVNNVTANVNLHGWPHTVPHGAWVHPGGGPHYIHGDFPEQGAPVLQPMGAMPVPLQTPNALGGGPVMNPNANTISGGNRGSHRGRGRGGASGSRRADYNMKRHPEPEGSPAPQQSMQNNHQDRQQQQQGQQPSDGQQMMTSLPPSYVPNPQYAAHASQYPYGYPTYFAQQQHMIHPGQSAAAQQATGTPLYFSAMPVYNGAHMYNYGYYLPPVMNQSEYQYGDEVGVGGPLADERQSGVEGGAMMWHQQAMYPDEYGMSPADMHAVSSDDINASALGSANETPNLLSPNYPPMYEQMTQQMGVMHIYDDPQMGQMQVMHPQTGVPQMEEELSECGSQATATIQMVPPIQMVPAPPMTLPAATNEQIIHQQTPHLIPVAGGAIMPIDETLTPIATPQHQIQQQPHQQQSLTGDNTIDSTIQTYENVSNIQPGESVTSLNEEIVQQPVENIAIGYQQLPQQQQQIHTQNVLVEAVQSDNFNNNNNKILMTDVQELQESNNNTSKVTVATVAVATTSADVAIETVATIVTANNQPPKPIYQQQHSQEKHHKQQQQYVAKQSVHQQPQQQQHQQQQQYQHQQLQTQPMPAQQQQPATASQQQTHYQAPAQHHHQQQQQQHHQQQTYENRKSSQMYNQQHQSRSRKYDYHHGHGSTSSNSDASSHQQQQTQQTTTKTMSWTNSSQHKKSTNTVAVTATPTSSHSSGSYNKQSNATNSSSSHAHATRTYTNQQHHNYQQQQQQQQQQNYHYQQQQQHQPQTRNYGAMKMPSSPISSAPSTMERKTSQSSDTGKGQQQQPQQQQQQQTTSTASTTAAPHQFQQPQTQQTSTNEVVQTQSTTAATVTTAGSATTTTISSKPHSQHYPPGFATKKHSFSNQGHSGSSATPTPVPAATSSATAVETPLTPAINLAPPVSSTTPAAPSTPSWASLFSSSANTASTTASSNTVASVSATNLNATSSSSSTSTAYSKKPIAKVAPYEGLTPVTPPPPVVTPGTLSYSAASAQNLPAPTASSASTTAVANKKEQQSQRNSLSNLDEYSLKFAEFLTKYKSDWATISLRPRGLTNRSNYCYINSILQALLGCSPLYNLIRSIPKQAANLCEVKTPTVNAMITFMSNFSNLPSGLRLRNAKGGKGNKDELGGDLQCDPAFEPTEIYKLWNDSREEHDEGRQEDAEEFLSYILNKLNDEMLEVIKLIAKPNNEQNGQNEPAEEDGDVWQMIRNNRNKGSVTRQTDFGCTPLSDIFRGELRSHLQREGEHSTDVIQPFFTLQLNIEKAASVKEALEILVGRDQLEGVTGSKSKQEVVAWQQINLEKLPPILILHLKWFDYRSDGCTKILKKVEFPVELKIDAKILASKKYSQKQRAYRLFAVVYHDGKEATKGHYITDVYHTGYGSWLRYDDSSVKPVSENHVLLPRTPRVPYLLCYRRCDTIPQQSNNNQNNSSAGNNNNSSGNNTQSSSGK